MREPALAWWPGRIEAGSTCREVSSALDVLPTVVQLAGGELPRDRTLDGRSLVGNLMGHGGPAEPEGVPFVHCGPGNRPQAIRQGPWKLHVATNSQTGSDHGWPDVAREKPLLFHLEHDPGERFDVAAEHPDVVRELLAALDRLERQVAREGTFWDEGD